MATQGGGGKSKETRNAGPSGWEVKVSIREIDCDKEIQHTVRDRNTYETPKKTALNESGSSAPDEQRSKMPRRQVKSIFSTPSSVGSPSRIGGSNDD